MKPFNNNPFIFFFQSIFLLYIIKPILTYSWHSSTELWDLEYEGSSFIAEVNLWSCNNLINSAIKYSFCYDGTYIMGGYNVMGGNGLTGSNAYYGNYWTKYYSGIGIPAHNQVNVTYTVYAVDSWDGTTSDDHYSTSVDGVMITCWHFSAFAGYAYDFCGTSSFSDFPAVRAYLTFPHTATSMTLTFTNYLDQLSTDESLGIRDIQLDFVTMASPALSICGRSNGTPLPAWACPCSTPNQYMNPPNSGTCFLCYTLCATCTAGTATDCTSCYPGYYLSGGQCLQCSSNCATCSGAATTCTSCNSGWFMVGTTCYPSCNFPLYSYVSSGVTYCATPCPGEYVMWDGSCSPTCAYSTAYSTFAISPATVDTFAECTYPCSSTQFLYFNGSCLSNCPSPLTTLSYYSRGFCDYSCPSSDYLYWNGSCLSTCPSPLSGEVEGTSTTRKFCWYTCQPSDYLYWNGSCLSTCPAPLSAETEGTYLQRKFCWYPCQPTEYLYWNESCLSTCPSPLSPETQGTYLQRNFCWYTCQPNQYLYWNGSCINTCPSPLSGETQGTYLQRNFCWYICMPWQWLYWDETCQETCSFPLSPEVQGTSLARNFCWFSCPPNQFLYWNGTCSSTCPEPLTNAIHNGESFCEYPCLSTQYLYWNGSCLNSCPSPLSGEVEGTRKFCWYTCQPNEFLYWDGSCQTSCNFPLVPDVEGSPERQFCWYLCPTSDFLYWNGTCSSQCDPPLTQRTSNSRLFCDYSCPSYQYLAWNGSCLDSCPYPLNVRVEGNPIKKNFCDYPCNPSEYLYWNGSCLSTCDSPLSTRIEGSPTQRKFCDYPCVGNQYLYWNGTCKTTCALPLVVRIDIDKQFCDYLCPASEVMFWDGSCGTSCDSPLVSLSQGTPVRYYCRYPCSGSQYLYWDGNCSASCDFPLTSYVFKSRLFCNYTCDTSKFLYFNGSCLDTCSLPYASRTDTGGLKYCDYPCEVSTEYLYWNGSCISTCASPLAQSTIDGYLYCDFPCNDTSAILYWNGTCAYSCPQPLTTETQGSSIIRTFCVSQCPTQYLYWNSTCSDHCDFPLTQSTISNINFCLYPCDPSTEYLYWNGSCLTSCDSPLSTRTEGSLNYCDYPCQASEYLYSNGSCIPECLSPLSSQTIASKLYCSFPCSSATDYLYWNQTCSSQCNFPLKSKTEGGYNFCQNPCDPSDFLYWNGSCLMTCPSPFIQTTDNTYRYCGSPCGDIMLYYYYPELEKCETTCHQPAFIKNSTGYLTCNSIEDLGTSAYQSSFDNLFLYAPLEEGTWTVVKLVKTMQYVKYLDINMPPRLQRLSISKGRNILSISSGLTMPESLQNKLTQSSQKIVPFVYLKNNLNANFLINYWDDLMTIVLAFLLACFFNAFEKLSHAFNWDYPANVFSTLRNIAQWNFPLMILAINIDDVILFSAIQFKTSSGASLSLFFSVMFILVILSLMGFIYFIARSLRKSSGKKFIGFQVLYSAFRNNNIFNQLFFMFYMLRIGLPILFAVVFESYPIIICVPQILISLATLGYILTMKPFIKKINHYQTLIFESVVLLMNISMLILTFLSNNGLQNHQFAIILGDIVILGNDCINIMCLFFLIIQVHHEALLLKEKTSKVNKPERTGLWCRLLFYILQQGNMGFEELSYIPHQTVKQKGSQIVYIEEDDRENLRFTSPDTLRKSYKGENQHDFSLVGRPGSPVPDMSTRDLGPTSFRDQLTINDFAMNQEDEAVLTFSGPTSTARNRRLQRGSNNGQKWIDSHEKKSYGMSEKTEGGENQRMPFETSGGNRLKMAGKQLTLAKRVSNKEQGTLTSSQGFLNSPNHSPILTFKDAPEDQNNDTLLMLQEVPSLPIAGSNVFEKSLLKNWQRGGLEFSLDGISGNNSQIASPANGFDLPFMWKEQDGVPIQAQGKRSYRQEGESGVKEQVKRQGSLAFDANLRMKEKKKMQQLENGEDDEEIVKKIQRNLASLNQILDEEDKPKAKFEYMRKGSSRINESVLRKTKSIANESDSVEPRNDENLRMKLWMKGKQHFSPNQ